MQARALYTYQLPFHMLRPRVTLDALHFPKGPLSRAATMCCALLAEGFPASPGAASLVHSCETL